MRHAVYTALALMASAFLLMFSGAVWAADITVSAAMSTKSAFEEMGRIFEARHPGTKVIFNFGASGDLKRQIEGGAPVDVFASASGAEMKDLEKKGLVIKDTTAYFAGNTVVLITPLNSKAASFEGLLRPDVGRVAIANPATSPAGKYSEEVLTHLGIWGKLKDKLIFSENVRQILDYVRRGEVDAGMLYLTDAGPSGDVRIAAKAPDGSHKTILYPIAVVKASKNAAIAREFVDTVLSRDGESVLKKYGFTEPKKVTPKR